MIGTAVSIAAALIALGSLYFAGRQVAEATRQTAMQREVSEAASQPYVWADVRASEAHGQTLVLVVGNSGPTVATDVQVRISPPFHVAGSHPEQTTTALQRLHDGMSSLPPGKAIHWALGPSVDLLNRSGPTAHLVTINCVGPFGRLEPLEYVIDLSDFRESIDSPAGTLYQVKKAIEKLGQQMKP